MIRRFKYTYFIIGLLSFVLFSCEKATVGTAGEIDLSVPVPYSTDIQPIFDANCTSCHPSAGGLDLTAENSYNDLLSSEFISTDTSFARTSILYETLTTQGGTHYSRATPDEKTKILTWLLQGAQNN